MITTIIILTILLAAAVTLFIACFRKNISLESIWYDQQERLYEKGNAIDELRKQVEDLELYRLEGTLAHLCLMYGKEVKDTVKKGSFAGQETVFRNCILFGGPRQFHFAGQHFRNVPSPIVGVFYEPEYDLKRLLRDGFASPGDIGEAERPLRFGLQGIIGTDICLLGDEADYIGQFGDVKEIVAAVIETLTGKVPDEERPGLRELSPEEMAEIRGGKPVEE